MPTQGSDAIATGTNDGIDFAPADPTWTINPGIIVYSPAGNGVMSSYDDNTLINNGVVKSSGGTGVNFSGARAVIFNNVGADIIGPGRSGAVYGGDGNDTLTGGPGADKFYFDTALDAATNVDRITHGTDKIDLSHAIFTRVNSHGTLHARMFFEGHVAHDASDRIVYNPATGWLTYDTNGSAHGGSTHFATLVAHLTLTNTDFLAVA